jgi:hypothetical protein
MKAFECLEASFSNHARNGAYSQNSVVIV